MIIIFQLHSCDLLACILLIAVDQWGSRTELIFNVLPMTTLTTNCLISTCIPMFFSQCRSAKELMACISVTYCWLTICFYRGKLHVHVEFKFEGPLYPGVHGWPTY